MRKWWVAWVALAVIVVVAVAVLVVRSRPSSSPSARAARLSSELACPVCTGESVAESNAPESRAIRRGSRTPRLSATADDVALVDRERAHHPDDGPDFLLDDGLGEPS